MLFKPGFQRQVIGHAPEINHCCMTVGVDKSWKHYTICTLCNVFCSKTAGNFVKTVCCSDFAIFYNHCTIMDNSKVVIHCNNVVCPYDAVCCVHCLSHVNQSFSNLYGIERSAFAEVI